MVGSEMVDWLMQQSSIVHSRNQAVGMWQALLEEGVIVHGKTTLTDLKEIANKCTVEFLTWSFIENRYSIGGDIWKISNQGSK